jgi:hypothetical protein
MRRKASSTRPAWGRVRASCCKQHPTPRGQTWTKRRAPRGGVAWRPERSGGHDRSRTWRQDQIYRKADKVKRRTAGGFCFKSLNWRTPGERILRVTLEIEPLLVISGPRQCANSNASVTRGVAAYSNAANDSLPGMRLLPERYHVHRNTGPAYSKTRRSSPAPRARAAANHRATASSQDILASSEMHVRQSHVIALADS